MSGLPWPALRLSSDALKLTVNEIDLSVQGESTWAGLPCVFVRLTFCDLRCTYCDTEYAFYEGNKMALGEIVEKVRSFGCPLVEVTGGEPLLQPNCVPLLHMLCEEGRNLYANIAHLTPRDELKFVVGSREDYEWAREKIRGHDLATKVNSVLLSPVFGKIAPSDMVSWMLEDKLPARFQLQMHKFIWEPRARGV